MRRSWQMGGLLVLLAPIAALAANPFDVAELSHGYGLDGTHQAAEGECGEGKCGEESEDKTGEGKCGEGKCGG